MKYCKYYNINNFIVFYLYGNNVHFADSRNARNNKKLIISFSCCDDTTYNFIRIVWRGRIIFCNLKTFMFYKCNFKDNVHLNFSQKWWEKIFCRWVSFVKRNYVTAVLANIYLTENVNSNAYIATHKVFKTGGL